MVADPAEGNDHYPFGDSRILQHTCRDAKCAAFVEDLDVVSIADPACGRVRGVDLAVDAPFWVGVSRQLSVRSVQESLVSFG